MTLTAAPICLGCTHYRARTPNGTGTCDAYPDAIPLTIWESADDHRAAVAGDHGVRFSPTDDESAAYANLLFAEDA